MLYQLLSLDGEFIGVFTMANNSFINWEKIGVYIALTAAFLTIITYIADIKERIRALEVSIEFMKNTKE